MNYIEIGKVPPRSKNELSTPEQLVENLKSLIGEKFPLTGKPRTDGSNFRKMITNHLLSNYIPMVLFDLAVLQDTCLPILVHDSVLLKQIEDVAIEKILDMYKDSEKQIFIPERQSPDACGNAGVWRFAVFI